MHIKMLDIIDFTGDRFYCIDLYNYVYNNTCIMSVPVSMLYNYVYNNTCIMSVPVSMLDM